MKASNRSPLIVWIILVSIVVPSIISVIIFIRTTDRPQRILDSRLKFNELASFQSGELGIVFIGNSLLKCGLPDTQETLADSLRNEFLTQGQRCEKIRVLNLATDGNDLSLLEKHLGQIVDLHPSVLIVQAEIVAPWAPLEGYRKDVYSLETASKLLREPLLTDIRKFSIEIRKPVANFLPALLQPTPSKENGPGKNLPHEVEINENNRFLAGAASDVGDDEHALQNVVTENTEQFQRGRGFIQLALERNISVFVIQTPFSVPRASRIPKAIFQKRTETVRLLFGSKHSEFFEYPRVLPGNYFVDNHHLNKKGRAIFLRWMNPIIVREVIRLQRCLI
jgi:hypothetical protein